jgi:hypothetical protein
MSEPERCSSWKFLPTSILLLVATAAMADGCQNSSPSQQVNAMGEPIALRWKFSNGQVLRYKLVKKRWAEVMGDTAGNESVDIYSLRVDDIDDQGSATITLTYDEVIDAYPSDGKRLEESFKNPTKPRDPTYLRSMLKGQSFTARMSSQGEILEISGYDALPRKAIGRIEDPQRQQKATQAFETRRQYWTNEGQKTELHRHFLPLPLKELAVGAPWKNRATDWVYMIGAIEFRLDHQIAQIESGKDVRLTGSVNVKGSGTGAQITDCEANWSGDFSVERGILVSARLNLKLLVQAGLQTVPVELMYETTLLEAK